MSNTCVYLDMAKRDARFLSPQAQAEIRLRVLDALQEGMTQAQAARTFGVSRWSVVQWAKVSRQAGEQALVAKPRGRRAGEAGKLSVKQSERMRKLVVGKMPDQLKLPFYLWTRAAVRELIKRECAVELSLPAVGGYLKRWGLTVQRPVKRAYERNDEAVAQWLAQVYPHIASRAKRERARIYWGDETGLRSDDVRGRSFAPIGQPAVVNVPGRRFGCNVISALTNKGEMSFMVFEGRFQAEQFIGFCQRLIKQSSCKVFLIVDGHPVHRSSKVKDWLEPRHHQIELFFLPGYAPELNPDELLNGDIKRAIGQARPRDRDAMKAATRKWLHRRQKQPDVLANLFHAPHVRYASA
jgi:transposase